MSGDNASSPYPVCPEAALSVSGSLGVASQELGMFQLEAYGIVGNLLTVVGLFFNALSIYVLRDQRVRSSTAVFLLALAAYDLVILLSMAAFFGLPALRALGPAMEAYYHVFRLAVPLGYPVSLAAHMGSIYVCVAFTVDRFQAVCRPLQLDCHLSRRQRAKRWILLISLLAVLYNLPRCFQYQTYMCWNQVTNRSLAIQRETAFGRGRVFQTGYLIYMHLAFMFVLPCTVLAVLNTALMLAIRRSQKLRKEMSRMRIRERNLTLMLVSLTGVFVVCQLPSIVDNILVASIGHDALVGNLSYMKFYTLSTLLVHVNSCVNFILYVAFGQRFRYVLRTKLAACALFRRLQLRKSELQVLSPTQAAVPLSPSPAQPPDNEAIEMVEVKQNSVEETGRDGTGEKSLTPEDKDLGKRCRVC